LPLKERRERKNREPPSRPPIPAEPARRSFPLSFRALRGGDAEAQRRCGMRANFCNDPFKSFYLIGRVRTGMIGFMVHA
jgi:hypothetical protein